AHADYLQLLRCYVVYANVVDQASNVEPNLISVLAQLDYVQAAEGFAALIRDPVQLAEAYSALVDTDPHFINNPVVGRAGVGRCRARSITRSYQYGHSTGQSSIIGIFSRTDNDHEVDGGLAWSLGRGPMGPSSVNLEAN